ncbi:MAG: tRNA lysidine(34) synthetase TilS [Proteobacteria bacterium]|nr:MAG: tRNA lysidine(34) synthetase TilS [Pseudomonadota bacterium]
MYRPIESNSADSENKVPVDNLLQKLHKNWEHYQLAVTAEDNRNSTAAKKPLTVIVCVSGGSDSVALLHLLERQRTLLNLEPHLLHFNHQLRLEAVQEQDFVRSLADQYEIPFHHKIAKHLKSGQPALQESAREWRIEESRKLLKYLGGGRIATGHQADDQLETLLLKLLRGTHISNLQGMQWTNEDFIRPLLNFRKTELQEYLKTNQLTWMEDTSNHSTAYLRNRVRLELIPLLEELTRQGLHSRINDLSEQSSLLREFLDSDYKNWQQNHKNPAADFQDVLPVKVLEQANDLLQQEILHNFITARTGQALSYRKLQNIFAQLRTGNNLWEIHLSQEWKIQKSGKNLCLWQNQQQ